MLQPATRKVFDGDQPNSGIETWWRLEGERQFKFQQLSGWISTANPQEAKR